jgi:diguanylate cyclase
VSNSSEYEKSLAQAHKALALMIERRCPATPQNYELWFNYSSGHNRALVAEVDRAVGDEGTLPQTMADKIYDENLASALDTQAVTDISEQMSGELAQVMSSLESAQGQASDYGLSLGSASEELDGASDQTDVKDIVARLLSSTKAMQDHNKALEQRLNSSHEQIAELSENLETARFESRNDQLTGIANRKAFDENIKAMTAAAIEGDQELCLLLGDIDHFKKFNDTYGHQTGDQVLRLVATCLTSVLKGQDFAARYGGEEFAVLLPETTLQAAITVGNHIRKTVLSKKLVKKSTGEDLGHVTMSFGAARFRPGEGIDTWVHRADACLYAAKGAGRNQVKCETDPDIDLDINAA